MRCGFRLKKEIGIIILQSGGGEMKVLVDVLFFLLVVSLAPLLFVVEEFVREFFKG